MKAALVVLLAVFVAQATAQDSSKPRIAPFFDRIDDGPVFFVDCRNTTDQKISSATPVWIHTLRLDGTNVPDSESELGPGLTTQIAPGSRGVESSHLGNQFGHFLPP